MGTWGLRGYCVQVQVLPRACRTAYLLVLLFFRSVNHGEQLLHIIRADWNPLALAQRFLERLRRWWRVRVCVGSRLMVPFEPRGLAVAARPTDATRRGAARQSGRCGVRVRAMMDTKRPLTYLYCPESGSRADDGRQQDEDSAHHRVRLIFDAGGQ